MRALVTGGGGFSGRHLVDLLAREGCHVLSLGRTPVALPGATSIEIDLADSAGVERAVREGAPDLVFHLAARTPANAPEGTLPEWLGGDPIATDHLLEAIREHAPRARVLVVSSSAVYDDVPSEALPIPETSPLRPLTNYGIAKAEVEKVALRFHRAHGLAVVLVRPFNFVGPGQGRGLLPGNLAAQVVAIAEGRTPAVLRMRHRATSRDWVDVRDAVRAYWMLLEKGTPGEVYNLGSGRGVEIGSLAERLLAIARVDGRVEETATGPAAGEILAQAADITKIRLETGWAPDIALDRSLADLLDFVRSRPKG